MFKYYNFEVLISDNEEEKQRALTQIKQIFKVTPRPAFGRNSHNLKNDRLKNIYSFKLFSSRSLVWDKAQMLANIDGVLDVDPIIKTKVSFELEEDEAPLNEMQNIRQKGRPDPKWYLSNSKFPEAIAYAKAQYQIGEGHYNGGETNLNLAHLDTGYTDHPELSKVKRELGYNYVNTILDRILSIFIGRPSKRNAKDRLRNARPFKWASHGTSTAGIIVGINTNNRGITGDAPDFTNGVFPHLNLIPYRISETIVSFNNKMAHAARQAMIDRCQVITMSHAGLLRIRSWKEAVREAYENGVIWVAAPGSHIKGVKKIWTYPAKFPETITATVSTFDNKAWEKGFGGKEVDIAAPGLDMYVPFSRKGKKYAYRWSEGSSFSTPITAAAAALWLAHHGQDKLNALYLKPWQKVEAFRNCLKESARRPDGWNTQIYGAGILDVLSLLKHPLPMPESLHHTSSKTDECSKKSLMVDWNDYILNKEITFHTCCAKIESQENDDNIFQKVEQRASKDAKIKMKHIVSSEENKIKSAELKSHVKGFADDWGY
ncbi:Subtilase family protein [Saccharicrinis carchari]|uniref:Subtilase family protein n=1 Tax=Saccharicrinis carchari TaxID=1168039 RepID=A0A521D3R4_SACCC|nr:S8/S53 family peptidase [Saccharicrinis carchari]SMO66297.1 Subtilase family protein [Saccharicrinis carchari]